MPPPPSSSFIWSCPSTVSAGMTDAKTADAQAGYEKGYTVALAAEAGADMINLSASACSARSWRHHPKPW